MKTIEEWYDTLTEMTEDTDYEVIIKTSISKPVVAIVPKGFDAPQRIAIYPKKTKNPGLVFESDILRLPQIKYFMGDVKRIHGNRPHYNDVPEQTIIEVCNAFLLKA